MLSEDEKRGIKKAIKRYRVKKILIQAPEGMKTRVQGIAKEIESFNVEAVIFADPCYGACDIPDYFACALDCDLMVQFGHTSMKIKSSIPVIYLECRNAVDIRGIIEKNVDELNRFRKICLATTVQHIGQLEKAKELLEQKGKKVFIGQPRAARYKGQVLGCDTSAVSSVMGKVECILFIGSGVFHALGIIKSCEKPVFIADVERGNIRELSKERELIEKRRIIKKEKFKDARKVGLLVSTKKGQVNKKVYEIKKKIESMNKEAWILAMDYISPEKLLGMEFDILVNTACPRIEEDAVFNVPVINWSEIENA